jgi:uncharacterized protein (TIGR02246 family)
MSISSGALAEDEVAVRNVVDGVLTAWHNYDADAFASLHADDATLVTVEGVYCKGREQIRRTMNMLYSGVFKGSKVFNEVEDVRFISDDVAVAICWNAILLGGLTELPPEEKRRATWVFSKQDGRWQVEAFENVFITNPSIEVV